MSEVRARGGDTGVRLPARETALCGAPPGPQTAPLPGLATARGWEDVGGVLQAGTIEIRPLPFCVSSSVGATLPDRLAGHLLGYEQTGLARAFRSEPASLSPGSGKEGLGVGSSVPSGDVGPRAQPRMRVGTRVPPCAWAAAAVCVRAGACEPPSSSTRGWGREFVRTRVLPGPRPLNCSHGPAPVLSGASRTRSLPRPSAPRPILPSARSRNPVPRRRHGICFVGRVCCVRGLPCSSLSCSERRARSCRARCQRPRGRGLPPASAGGRRRFRRPPPGRGPHGRWTLPPESAPGAGPRYTTVSLLVLTVGLRGTKAGVPERSCC